MARRGAAEALQAFGRGFDPSRALPLVAQQRMQREMFARRMQAEQSARAEAAQRRRSIGERVKGYMKGLSADERKAFLAENWSQLAQLGIDLGPGVPKPKPEAGRGLLGRVADVGRGIYAGGIGEPITPIGPRGAGPTVRPTGADVARARARGGVGVEPVPGMFARALSMEPTAAGPGIAGGVTPGQIRRGLARRRAGIGLQMAPPVGRQQMPLFQRFGANLEALERAARLGRYQ